MLRAHLHAFLDGIRGEDRYRIFTDLERHADHPPYATWHRTTTSAWDVTLPSSMR
jgi:hypothetical protein